MGLDVTAYQRIIRAGDHHEPDGVKYVRLTINADFPNAAPELTGGIYLYEGGRTMNVVGMPYSMFNEWRNWLAKVAGYPAVPEQRADGLPDHAFARGAWAAGAGPFIDLINFSDCEGTIGPAACVRLLADFDRFLQEADAQDAWFIETYQAFRTGLQIAAPAGCLAFH
jgi:hypothetical protein